MNQRTRMATVLVVLACGMTSTAALLAWMDPSWPTEPHKLSSQQLLTFARSAVLHATAVESRVWQSIEIRSAADPSTSGIPLTAQAWDDVHFVVDPAGRLIRLRAWTDQRPLPPSPESVRVQVIGAPDMGLTPPQRATLRALTRAINEVISPGHIELPIFADSALLPVLAGFFGYERTAGDPPTS